MKRSKVLLVGEFGCGNYGNEASLLSVVRALRARDPEVQIKVLARNPRRLDPGLGVHGLDIAYRPIPGRLGSLLGRLSDPLRYLRHVMSARAVIVPGMGVIEGELGEYPAGMPLLLYSISMVCRLTRTPFALVGVGASPLRNRYSRWMCSRACRGAQYRTFRDEYSLRSAVHSGCGLPTDTVTADVAFAIAPSSTSSMSTGGIGVGLMRFFGRYPAADAARRAETGELYLQRMKVLCRGLASRNRSVRIFAGDDSDVAPARSTADELKTAEGLDVTFVEADTYESIAGRMAHLDVVIASRYHNLVAAVAAERPIIPLRYAEKGVELARRVGMDDCAPDLDDWNPAEVLDVIDSVLDKSESSSAAVAAAASRMRKTVSDELALIAELACDGVRSDWSRQSLSNRPQ